MFTKPDLLELSIISLKSITRNKSRTFLTSLGIIIGVTSVILLTSIGSGIKIYIQKQFEDLGSNIVIITPGQVFDSRGSFKARDRNTVITQTFTEKDSKLLKNAIGNRGEIVASVQFEDKAKYKQTQDIITIVGTQADYGRIRNSIPSDGNGRWFSQQEDELGANVVVLGHGISDKLFPHQSPLGKTVSIGSKNLKVIGVVDKKGGSLGGPDFDNYCYIPLESAFLSRGNRDIQSFFIQAKSGNDVNFVKTTAEKTLLSKYDKDNFSVFDQSQILSTITGILSTLTAGLTGIAAISLIVGGIGIMNIMLVTVTERTKEIGLRKAIGATPNAILAQFLIEAIILSCFGGAIGIILGGIFSAILNKFFPAQVTPTSVAIAFGVSSIVGIIFGAAPARRASKLSPIEALRYE
jgi:putative ABC transport system permease protein